MTVSILLPYYNDREFIRQSIESILNQTYQDFELILVNHATKDDCREIAHSYKDPRIKHIDMDQNYGAGTGLILIEFLKLAKGKYIKPFCADDVMYPNCLEDMVNYMETHPQIDFAFGNVEYINKDTKSLNKNWFKTRYRFSIDHDEIKCLQEFFNGHGILPYIGSFAKREIFNTINIEKAIIMLIDMSIWVNLLIKGYKIGFSNKLIAGYRVHENQVCSSKSKDSIYQCCKLEGSKYMELFFQIEDIDVMQKLLSKNKWVQTIPDLSLEDLRFIMAFEILINPMEHLRYTGFYYINNCLNNDNMRKYLEKKFNFGIREFRAIYSKAIPIDFYHAQNLKFSQIAYLFFKKLLFKITLKEYFDNKKLKAL